MHERLKQPQAPLSQDSKKKRRRRRSKKLYVLLSVCLFLCLLAIGAGFVLSEVEETLDVVTDDPYKLPDQVKVEQPYEGKQSLSFVIIGVDTRKNIGMLNTDVLVVAVANPVTQKMTMVSLPRDTRVQIPGSPGYHKINEVFAIGEGIRERAESKGQTVTENGMTLLKKTLEHMLGIKVGHYVQLDFEGFTDVIDKLGGVQVNVDKDMVYELPQEGVYRHLKKGTQLLKGEQALGFVRHRLDKRGEAYYSSDYDRNRRQQQVIKAVVDKLASVNGIGSLTAILEISGNHIRTNLSKEQIKGLVKDFGSISSGNVVSLDNGAVWSSPYSFWPKEKIEAVRTALWTEIGSIDPLERSELSDAAVLEIAQAEGKKQPKQAEKSPKTPQKQAKQAVPPKTKTTSSPSTQPESSSSDMPPPDILAPPAPVESTATSQSGT